MNSDNANALVRQEQRSALHPVATNASVSAFCILNSAFMKSPATTADRRRYRSSTRTPTLSCTTGRRSSCWSPPSCRAVDRCAGQPRHTRLVQALPECGRPGESSSASAREADQVHRLLPPESEGPDRHGQGARRGAWRRSAGRHGAADHVAWRRTQDGQRGAGSCARSARPSRRSTCASVAN